MPTRKKIGIRIVIERISILDSRLSWLTCSVARFAAIHKFDDIFVTQTQSGKVAIFLPCQKILPISATLDLEFLRMFDI